MATAMLWPCMVFWCSATPAIFGSFASALWWQRQETLPRATSCALSRTQRGGKVASGLVEWELWMMNCYCLRHVAHWDGKAYFKDQAVFFFGRTSIWAEDGGRRYVDELCEFRMLPSGYHRPSSHQNHVIVELRQIDSHRLSLHTTARPLTCMDNVPAHHFYDRMSPCCMKGNRNSPLPLWDIVSIHLQRVSKRQFSDFRKICRRWTLSIIALESRLCCKGGTLPSCLRIPFFWLSECIPHVFRKSSHWSSQ
jgi:hypothetical protein